MINKWKAKIVKRGLYNRRNPQWKGAHRINRESIIAISRTSITILIQYLQEQNSSDCAKNKLSLINSVYLCLIVMNTILTAIHALKSSSLTHSLQIYCTGLTGPRSYTPWAWIAKRVPTIGAFGGRACVLVSATVNHGRIKVPSVRVPREDHFGGGACYTKASPLFPRAHKVIVIT